MSKKILRYISIVVGIFVLLIIYSSTIGIETEKFNKIKRNLIDLRKEELEKAFKINAKINPWHPGLKKSIKSTIEVIEKYKESQKDWKEVRKNK